MDLVDKNSNKPLEGDNDDVEIVYEAAGDVFIYCEDEDEVSPFTSDIKNTAEANEIARDIIGQVLDRLALVDQNCNKPVEDLEDNSDVEIVYEAAGPEECLKSRDVFLYCEDEVPPFDSDIKNTAEAEEIAHDIMGQVLDGMALIDQNCNKAVGDDKDVEIVYEATWPDKCLKSGDVFIRCEDEVSLVYSDITVDAQEIARDIMAHVLNTMVLVDQNCNKPVGGDNDMDIVYEAAGPDEVEVICLDDDSDTDMAGVGDSPETLTVKAEEGDDGKEEESFNAEFQAVNPVTPRPERHYNEFQPVDESEREDIMDEGWEVQKSLKTDLQRLRYAQRAFGNCIPTDPTRCLTFHGFSTLSEEQRGALKFPVGDANRWVLEKRWMWTKIEDGRLFNEDAVIFDSPEVGSRKRKANDGHVGGPDRKRRKRVQFERIERNMWRLLDQVKRPLFDAGYDGGYYKKNFYRYVGHYKSGLKETREFLNFYDDENNNTLIASEVNHIYRDLRSLGL